MTNMTSNLDAAIDDRAAIAAEIAEGQQELESAAAEYQLGGYRTPPTPRNSEGDVEYDEAFEGGRR